MAESGCLHNERFSSLDVDNILDTKDTIADNKMIFVNVSGSSADTGSSDSFSTLQEGIEFELHKKTETAINSTTTNTVSVDITWPAGSLVKNISFMLVEPTDNTRNHIKILSANNLQVKLGTKKGETSSDVNIMSAKKLIGDSTQDGFLYKNMPVTIVNNFTGIHASEVKQNYPAFYSAILSNNRQEAFNILDPKDSWTGSLSEGPFYPLYNPNTTDAQDKIIITLEQVAQSGGGAVNWTADQDFKVIVLCKFVKMNHTGF